MIEVKKTDFKDLLIIKPRIFNDDRGYFFESYNAKRFKDAGIAYDFVQDNQSFSQKGTLRGLHFQKGKDAQSKLVRVLKGRIYDVVVDLRKEEKTFGKTFAIELSDENQLQLLVPKGFAHSFVVLSEQALVHYKCDNYYAPQSESGIHYADPDLAIDWQIPKNLIHVSAKDNLHPSFKEICQDESLISHWG